MGPERLGWLISLHNRGLHLIINNGVIGKYEHVDRIIRTSTPPSPNPFAGETYLSFYLPQAGPATLEVLDPLGRLVARESYDRYRAGTQQRLWDARELPAGSYIVRLVTPEHISTQRVIHR